MTCKVLLNHQNPAWKNIPCLKHCEIFDQEGEGLLNVPSFHVFLSQWSSQISVLEKHHSVAFKSLSFSGQHWQLSSAGEGEDLECALLTRVELAGSAMDRTTLGELPIRRIREHYFKGHRNRVIRVFFFCCRFLLGFSSHRRHGRWLFCCDIDAVL